MSADTVATCVPCCWASDVLTREEAIAAREEHYATAEHRIRVDLAAGERRTWRQQAERGMDPGLFGH